MTKEWLFNIKELDKDNMLYDPNMVELFVTISEEDADVYNETVEEDQHIYPDDIGGHVPDVEHVVNQIGGDTEQIMECTFLVPKNNRTVDDIIKEVQSFGWTLKDQ